MPFALYFLLSDLDLLEAWGAQEHRRVTFGRREVKAFFAFETLCLVAVEAVGYVEALFDAPVANEGVAVRALVALEKLKAVYSVVDATLDYVF